MSPFASWLTSAPPDAAVEITPERISAAMVAVRGDGPVVTAHASESLQAGVVTASLTSRNIVDRPAAAAALRRVFDRLPSRPRRVALVIPDSAAKISLVRFDQTPGRRDDLDQLIRWHVRKSTPFPIEDASVSYAPGLKVGDAGREFLVLLARRTIVGEYEGVCEDAGAHAGLVDLATISLLNMYLAAAAAPSGDWLLVHERVDSTSVAIMRGEDIIFYRNRAEGEEDSLSDLVHQTTMYYQDRLSGAGFSRVLVGGLGRSAATVDVARRSLEERLGVAVESVDPTRIASLTDRISASRDLLDVLGPLVGISLRHLRAGVAA